MARSKLDKAVDGIHSLDDATQNLIRSIEAKDRRFRFWAYTSLTILLIVGIVGIYRQNSIADGNRAHIDCIVKLFTSPDRTHKVIANPETSCNIRSTQ